MVIVHNLTLENAYTLLTQLWTNKTSNVTAFALPVAREFYTLGFAWQVSKLVANASLVNTGNWTQAPPSPPPKPWYEQAWNTVCGIAQWVWNAAVAVVVFVVNAAVWLANVAIGTVIGLATGNWDYFEKNVVEPFKKALEALIQFAISWITVLMQAIVQPLLDVLKRGVTPYGESLGGALMQGLTEEAASGSVSGGTGSRIHSSTFAPFFYTILAIGTAIGIALIVLTMIPMVGLILALVAVILAVIILVAFFSTANLAKIQFTLNIGSLTDLSIWSQVASFAQNNVHSPPNFKAMLEMYADLFSLGSSFYGTVVFASKTDASGWIALVLSIVVSLLGISTAILIGNQSPAQLNPVLSDLLALDLLIWAFFGLILGTVALFKVKEPLLKPWAAVAEIFGFVAAAFAVTQLMVPQ